MIQNVPFDIIASVAVPTVTVAAAFFGVKYGLNGARADIKEIKGGVEKLHTGQTNLNIKVAELGTELRGTKEWVGAIEGRLERHIEIDT